VIFAVSVWTLALQGRTPVLTAVIATPDLLLAALFVMAWVKTKPEPAQAAP